MRIFTETQVRGEQLATELSEADFCPECCGTLEVAGTGPRAHLRCTSCFLAFHPRPRPPGPEAAQRNV